MMQTFSLLRLNNTNLDYLGELFKWQPILLILLIGVPHVAHVSRRPASSHSKSLLVAVYRLSGGNMGIAFFWSLGRAINLIRLVRLYRDVIIIMQDGGGLNHEAVIVVTL
jgi:hypothetical protein